MPASPTTHPSADTLHAFGLGKLDDATAEAVLSHVEGCRECREKVAALSGDDFLDRLRDAHGRSGTPAPGKSLSGVARSLYGTRPSQAVHVSPPILDLPPELANSPQYEVVRELGRGGMGVVYLAKNVLMDRPEVLKVVNKALLDRPGAAERFLREIRSAARLSHANVVKAYSALQLGEVLVFGMEYVEGEDLAKVVKERGPLPVPNACFYAHQAALGLQHAHEHGMVHRDIKPQNLILAREGKKHFVKVLDFGLAKATREGDADTDLTGAGKMMGTPDYIAPEQTLDAANVDIRADIYSLGCTLYFLLTGAPPFKGKSLYEVLQAHISLEARPLDQVREEVPAELAAVVAKMMAKDPARRYQKPTEVALALAPFVRAAKASPGSKSVLPTPPASGSAGKGTSQEMPRPTQAAPVRQETMIEGSSTVTEARKKTPARAPRAPAPKSAVKKWWLIGAGAGVALLLALVVLWAAGVFKVKTKDGTIVLENLPDDAEVLVDGATVKITMADGKLIEVAAGKKHRLEVKMPGFKVFGEEVEIDAGGRRAVVVRLEKEPPAPGKGKENRPADAGNKPPAQDDDYVALFNGKDLTGWETQKAGPANRRDPWEVKDGVLIGCFDVFGSWGELLTKRSDYQNFRFRVMITPPDGDGWAGSVLYLRQEKAAYHALIGSSKGRDVAETGVIAIGKLRRTPELPLRFGRDDWFTQEVVVEGKRIRVLVNGVQVNELVLGELPKPGRLGIRLAGISTMRILKMDVKELPNPDGADK